MAADCGYLLLALGQDAADDGAAYRVIEGEHALHVDIGRRGLHPRIGGGHAGHRLPVREHIARPADLHMRGHAEDAGAQLVLKAVHHRQHRDQRRHPERDAQHRGERDEGDEMVAPLGAGVAQADEQFVGKLGHFS